MELDQRLLNSWVLCLFTHIHTNTHTQAHSYKHTHTHTHTHTSKHAHKHTHTHTLTIGFSSTELSCSLLSRISFRAWITVTQDEQLIQAQVLDKSNTVYTVHMSGESMH